MYTTIVHSTEGKVGVVELLDSGELRFHDMVERHEKAIKPHFTKPHETKAGYSDDENVGVQLVTLPPKTVEHFTAVALDLWILTDDEYYTEEVT